MGVESGEGLVVASDFGHGDSQSKVIFRARQKCHYQLHLFIWKSTP
jgi:hypothetical protein